MAEDLVGALNARAWFVYMSSPYMSDLLTTAEALAADGEEAEELLVSAMDRALHDFRAYPVTTDLRVWLFRALVRTYQSPWRRAARWLRRGVSGEGPRPLRGVVSGSRSEAGQVRAALGQLPARCRVPLVLGDVAGFTYRQIGEILGVPVGQVRSRIARARQALGRLLGVAAARAGTGRIGVHVGAGV